jgi:hypothetical protein
MKWHLDHVEWAPYVDAFTQTPEYQCYFWYRPNWLGPKYRFLGVRRMWIDGPHVAFGFWWFNLSWSCGRSLPPYEFCNKETRRRWDTRPRWLRRVFQMEAHQP